MKQKIIIISNYYPPEMGAASNRIKNLAEGLILADKEVTVICPLPNYPKGKIFKDYKGKFSITEKLNGVTIKRYWSYPSKSKNSLVRLLSMLSFALTMWTFVFNLDKKKQNLCIINSPPLFIAMSGLLMSKFIGCKNILNVSDLWPSSALELGVLKKGRFYNLLKKVELLNYRLSDKICGQSNEIIEYISNLVVRNCLVYRNVPVYKKYETKHKEKGKLTIVYAGLLGYAQGILNLCKNIDFKKLDVEFHIYGDGMEKDKILDYSMGKRNNIFFHGSFNALEVKEKIREHDVAIVPLKNRIQGAVPSKLFELMQLGVPILYTCKEGEAAKIILENNLGLVSESNNYESIKDVILKFKYLADKDFLKISENCLTCHKKEYRLDFQLSNFISYI